MLFGGVDVGSLTTDAVIIDRNKKILSWKIMPTGASISNTLKKCREELEANIDNSSKGKIVYVSTGYGRRRVDFASNSVTEITAHALGASHFFPGIRTVIDMGGQDTKVITVSDKGKVVDFVMNDRCAAGTGRFIEVMASILQVNLDDLSRIASGADSEVEISSTCTVFAESEIISLITDGLDPGVIARGVLKSIAQRILAMVNGINSYPPYALTGGVSKNRGLVSILRQKLDGNVFIPENPQLTGAMGAAIYGSKN